MATAAGRSVSISAGRTGRTRGSGATATGPSMAIRGWCGRWSRAGPQCGLSRSHSGATAAAGPTMVEQRRPARRARSAKAAAAARSAPGTAKGIRLAPARQTASSSRPAPKPQGGAPSAAAAVPLDSTRPARTQAATGSVASSRCTALSSASSRTRAVGVRSTEDAGGSADADDGRSGRQAHLLGDTHGLFDEGLDDLRLGDGLDDLALHEDLALPVAGGHAEVGLAGLAGAVDDTAHDRDPQRHLEPLEPGGHLVGELVDVDLRPPARRAGDDLQPARAEVER